MSKLSAKEVTFITELMGIEAQACKKARLYSKTLTDVELAKSMEQIASSHEKRFNALLNLL